jgi:hypothetical protein
LVAAWKLTGTFHFHWPSSLEFYDAFLGALV